MELDIYFKVIGSLVLAYVVVLAWRLLNWIWIRPKKLEKILRNQGFKGNPYRLLYGDVKELAAARKEARSKPISLSDDIIPRATPTVFTAISKHGKKSFVWLGPRPAVYITDPNLIKEALNKTSNFQKLRGGNPLFKLLASGLVSAEGETWAKHRKIMNPAFHLEKLKIGEVAAAGIMVHVWVTMEKMVRENDAFSRNDQSSCSWIQKQMFTNSDASKLLISLPKDKENDSSSAQNQVNPDTQSSTRTPLSTVNTNQFSSNSIQSRLSWNQNQTGTNSGEPELQEIQLTREDEILITGCDGLWDVMSSQFSGSKKRNGGAALNEFLQNIVKNMQAANLNTSRSPLGTPDTDISHNDQIIKIEFMLMERNSAMPEVYAVEVLDLLWTECWPQSMCNSSTLFIWSWTFFDKVYRQVNVDFQFHLNNIKENVQPN
ncbi:hypothetical protein ACET3Z_016224 [Daucus carota]